MSDFDLIVYMYIPLLIVLSGVFYLNFEDIAKFNQLCLEANRLVFKDTTKINKALNAVTDTLNASAGYAENWKDFGNNLVVNGIANTAGLIADKISLGRAAGRPLVQWGKKFFKQGLNSSADKLKNTFYNDEDG